jgi:hypothetical protein
MAGVVKKTHLPKARRPWLSNRPFKTANPSGVRGPVLAPPCILYQPCHMAGLLQGVPGHVPGRVLSPPYRSTEVSERVAISEPDSVEVTALVVDSLKCSDELSPRERST